MQLKDKKDSLYLFQSRLDQILNLPHSLCKLSRAIDWSVFEAEFGPYYSEGQGRPAKTIRLMVGVHYLKYAFNESDESVVERLLENPYWQYFCGFEYFQHDLPVDPTTLVKWRKRVGAEKLELLLKETVNTARRCQVLKRSGLKRVNVDTTVQEKAIAFPTDSGLYQKMRIKLVIAARDREIKFRQSYVRKGKKSLIMQSRYRHARCCVLEHLQGWGHQLFQRWWGIYPPGKRNPHLLAIFPTMPGPQNIKGTLTWHSGSPTPLPCSPYSMV